jgi:hypothetical protein
MVCKAKGYAWEARFSEWLTGKRYQRTMTFQGTEADAKFGGIITHYRRKFLPSESRLPELKKKLHKVFPADGALVDALNPDRRIRRRTQECAGEDTGCGYW